MKDYTREEDGSRIWKAEASSWKLLVAMKEVRQRRVVCVSLDLAGDSKLFKGNLEARG